MRAADAAVSPPRHVALVPAPWSLRAATPPARRHRAAFCVRAVRGSSLLERDPFPNHAPEPNGGNEPPKGPKFPPFVVQAGIRQAMFEYRYRTPLANAAYGDCATSLLIRPISPTHLTTTTDLLTDSFGDTMGYLPLYRRLLHRQIKQYLLAHAFMPPKAIILIGVLEGGPERAPQAVPRPAPKMLLGKALDDSATTGTGIASVEDITAPTPEDEEEGAAGTLVASVELSLAVSSRSRYLTLNPPKDGAFLCNMAVAAARRRQGIGLHMLAAVEEVARLGGKRDVYLHARFKDEAATRLYERAGYQTVKQDNPFVLLLGQDRRYLMHKRLSPVMMAGDA